MTHAAACVRPGGVVFGSTILAANTPINPVARFVMDTYNARGIFHNRNDSLAALQVALSERFASYTVEVHGTVALFEGRVG